MRAKKRTPHRVTDEGSAASSDCPTRAQISQWNIEQMQRCSQGAVSYYPGKGVTVSAPGGTYQKKNDKRGIRGTVKGWSMASRHRMRTMLLRTEGPEGWQPLGVTLTVPPPLLTAKENQELWKRYCREMDRAGYCGIWRVEIQERGALHWHAIVWTPATQMDAWKVRLMWEAALQALGPVKFDKPYFGHKGDWKNGVIEANSRMALPGADVYACHIKQEGSVKGAWLRYLQDHASKGKQEQIPENIGRHWGAFGRARLRSVLPAGVDKMEGKAFNRFLRAFQRLCTPMVKRSGVPFGTRKGRRVRRGSRGRSVWFSRPETVKRLVEWAMSQ